MVFTPADECEKLTTALARVELTGDFKAGAGSDCTSREGGVPSGQRTAWSRSILGTGW